jgi:hypothetical protein
LSSNRFPWELFELGDSIEHCESAEIAAFVRNLFKPLHTRSREFKEQPVGEWLWIFGCKSFEEILEEGAACGIAVGNFGGGWRRDGDCVELLLHEGPECSAGLVGVFFQEWPKFAGE